MFMAESREALLRMCERMKFNISVNRSKVLLVRKIQRVNAEKIKVNKGGMVGVVKFRYLGMTNVDCGITEEVYS